MKSIHKRLKWLSILLVICLIITIIPVNGFSMNVNAQGITETEIADVVLDEANTEEVETYETSESMEPASDLSETIEETMPEESVEEEISGTEEISIIETQEEEVTSETECPEELF